MRRPFSVYALVNLAFAFLTALLTFGTQGLGFRFSEPCPCVETWTPNPHPVFLTATALVQPPPASPTPINDTWILIKPWGVNVRAYPSTSAPVLGGLWAGSVFVVERYHYVTEKGQSWVWGYTRASAPAPDGSDIWGWVALSNTTDVFARRP